MAPEVIADPIGVVVDLVAGFETALDRAAIEAVVTSVSGGRAKRRRLAQALLDKPTVLSDGRSPAPRMIGDLLIALREAGAERVSLPLCAHCGKQLRTVQRRGEDWYCAVCIRPQPRRCASCGQEKIVATVDRGGQPRCKQCPDEDDRDPLVVLTEVIGRLDPSVPSEVIVAAARRMFSRPAKLRQLAWAVEGAPNLLSGDGARAPTSGVLRLINELCDAGAQAITRPACPGCDRIIRLHRRIDGRWHCRNCVAKSRAQPCARCGAVREAATRDQHGQPLCPNCFVTDPANLEPCAECGRHRPVSIRTPGGPLCQTCVPWKTLICGICGRDAPCVISEATGKPWCRACKQRWIQCAGCGEVDRLRGGTLDEPLCSTCTLPDPEFWRSCPGCGQPGRIHNGRCARCTVNRRLRDLFANDSGEIHAELRALHDALAATPRTATVAAWLDKSAAPTILRELAGQPLTHESLDALPAGKPVEHLRSVLVAIDTLPTRDEQMSRIERWISQAIAERSDPDEQHLLRRYAIWHMLRRLRQRTAGSEVTHTQFTTVRQHVRAATVLLDWLAARDLTLTTCNQADLDRWLTDDHATLRRESGHFVRWARKHKLTRLDFPAAKWGGPRRVIDTEARWEQARRLLHDNTIKTEDRVAGLLVLLYAQWPAAVSRLTLDHVREDEDQVRLSLGREPVVLPEPLAGLVLELVNTRRGHAAIGDQGSSPWLFPGGQPGRPISAFQLAERLRQLGLQTGQARSTALFQLATELPAALLARMLGIHISVAVAWQRASAGDWTNYAAEVSRRMDR